MGTGGRRSEGKSTLVYDTVEHQECKSAGNIEFDDPKADSESGKAFEPMCTEKVPSRASPANGYFCGLSQLCLV